MLIIKHIEDNIAIEAFSKSRFFENAGFAFLTIVHNIAPFLLPAKAFIINFRLQ